MRETDDGDIVMSRREYNAIMAAAPASHEASSGIKDWLFGESDAGSDGPGLLEDFEVRHGDEHIITDPETIEFIGAALDVEKPNKYDHGVRIKVAGDVAVKDEVIEPKQVGTTENRSDAELGSVGVETATFTVDADADVPLTIDHDGSEYEHKSIEMATADTSVGPFVMGAKGTATENNTQNHTLSWGYNVEGDGTQIDTSEPTIRSTTEARYDDGSNIFFENHLQGLYADGTSWRAIENKISRDGSAPSTRRLNFEKITFHDDPVDANSSNRASFLWNSDIVKWENPVEHQYFADDGTRWDVKAGSFGRWQFSAGGSGVAEFTLFPADGTNKLDLNVPLHLNGNAIKEVGSIDINPSNTYSISNDATDRTYDANNTTTAELADVLATVIKDLGLDA